MKLMHKLSFVLFNIMAVIFGFAMLFTSLMSDPEIVSALSMYAFGTGRTETIYTGKEPVYYKTWYQSIDDLMAGSGEIAASAEAEGAVLIKNEEIGGGKRALPLDVATDKISLFGVTAYNPMYSLDGAGEVIINKDRQQFFKSEFEKEGFTVNNDLAAWYGANASTYNRGTTGSNGYNVNINGASWDDIESSANKTASGYNTAIYVIGRMTNEAIDLPPYNFGAGINSGTSGLTDGDYLRLTAKESELLTGLNKAKEDGHFDRIIVLINAANPIQEDFINNATYGIDAALWIGFPGTNGITAVAQILSGTVTPSGRLSTMWYANKNANPTWNNYGHFNSGGNYVLYQEGMYLGYRYAETRYEDHVMGTTNAGTYDYNANVNYPFGYGLSYASFTQEFVGIELDANPEKNYDFKGDLKPATERRKTGDDYIATVKVTNIHAKYSGKEVVQIYLQQPYTVANSVNKVEKPAVELVGFGKTSKLAPGDSEEVKIKIDANKCFAAYDITANKYILDQGTYYLTAAQNSNDAVNNILVAKEENDPAKMTGEGNASLVKTVSVDGARSDAYEYWTLGGATVTNLFDHADPNKVDPNGNKITFMTRDNWSGSVFVSHQTVNDTAARRANRAYDSGDNYSSSKTNYPYYKDEYPKYDQPLNEERSYGKNIAEGEGLMLADMIGVEYEDSRYASDKDKQKWEDFLDQLSWAETVKLIGEGRRKTEAIDSITKPYTNDVNASNGISWKFDMKLSDSHSKEANNQTGFAYRFDAGNRDLRPVGYPCESIIAASFNIDLAYAVGQSIGEDGLWAGASGLYGFGLNLHRNPYQGRAGEYYSDDSFLTGVMAGWSSKGAQSKGLYVYNKHFVLNDQETNRASHATWITEQTLRQIYIRPFEIAIEIGDAMNVMTAFNRIGTMWSGNDHNLMTKCLRWELGMRGFAVTDWYKSSAMNMTNGILAGNDLPDGSATNEFKDMGPGTGNGHLAQAMRISAQRILYTVANSNAMNFYGEGTTQKTYDPAWFAVRDGIIIAIVVVFIVSTVFMLGTNGYIVFKRIKNKK